MPSVCTYYTIFSVNKFNDRRNQSIQNKYFKMLKKSGDGSNTAGSKKDTTDGSGKPSGGSFKMAKLDFERRKKKAEKMEKAAEKKRQVCLLVPTVQQLQIIAHDL